MRQTIKAKALNTIRNNRKVFNNAFFLTIIQTVNYLLPLITVPYLVRVLGTERFGFIAFAGSLMAYFQIIIDYGFNLSATREVSLHKKDTPWLSNHFFSVLAVKSTLALICLAVLGIIVFGIPRFHNESLFYFLLFIGLVGNILFPVWFFQGMEEMGYITFFNLIARLITTVLYFVLIKTPNDYLWMAWLGVIASWSTGVASIIFALKRYSIRFFVPGLASYKACLAGGFRIFITQISVSLFTNTNTFLLGLFTNNVVVGHYAIGEKIVRAVVFLSAPIGGAIYPRVSVLFGESKERALGFLRKILIAGIGFFGLMSGVLFVGADLFVWLVSGHQSKETAFLIRIMSILPLSIFVDNIYGTQIMLNINLKNKFMWIILLGGLFSVTLQIIMVPLIKATGTSIAFSVSEVSMALFMIWAVRKEGIFLFSKPAI